MVFFPGAEQSVVVQVHTGIASRRPSGPGTDHRGIAVHGHALHTVSNSYCTLGPWPKASSTLARSCSLKVPA